MNIENIIFDVDGTLWDSTGEVAKAWNLAVKELGIECEEITSDTLKREFGKPMNVIADHLFPSASAGKKNGHWNCVVCMNMRCWSDARRTCCIRV